ncbi:acyl-CoA dehydrogenase [Methylopila jiangsuensis]|uniref:3-methylmercaptopropionyl-CoA dehydrogenase n=1 Tax=Methylopila jiangsuensis TaxID=586230 RepID=A0A9W6JGS9_9HYPH|nr:acyl-CoA dehydrogenase family protein [Methylopila jiangsuensis]MDR6285726.1 alkylation response protein AidB-like acyl-CoA dehydrogenase [Methylopila jiangsuensis]GLK75484.1 acyl-CoA dehydrogenase [Methylopila jiangsuensis]
MTYRAPVDDILFTLDHAAGLAAAREAGLYDALDRETFAAILAEAGAFAEDVVAPLLRPGDREGARFADGAVTTPAGFREAYKAWAAAGWNGVLADEAYGGQGLPAVLWAATTELWASASMAFGLCPMLTQGAIEALQSHGSDALKALYLPKLVSGEWTGTMNLTEPQAGSDLALLRTRAERAGDGTYRLFGQKIFITYGEHDASDNIVHLVLARLPDAPEGTRGISLFLAPKFIPDAEGKPGARNDVACVGIEEKLGIHASPTCTMAFGDAGGAVAYLVGEEHRGLACMFTMMNNARLGVGLEGVAVAERATQQALAFAAERKQGRAPGYDGAAPIAAHPDVRRMLLTMRAQTAAARAICYRAAVEIDRARATADADEARAASERASLLIPIAKAFSTDAGCEVASLGVQVHGGMGFIEETGAAQLLRDARIAPIYEGTNGIQAMDLVMRKLPQSGGAVAAAEIGRLRDSARRLAETNAPALGASAARLAEAVDALDRATAWMQAPERDASEKLAGATPYLRLFALAAGGAGLADNALGALRSAGAAAPSAHAALARFFMENLVPAADGLARVATEGAGALGAEAEAALAV